MEIPRFEVSQWSRFDGLIHGFLGRPGGQGRAASSCVKPSEDSDDNTETVRRNWCDLKLAAGLGEFTIVTANQVHGDTILKVSSGMGKRAGIGDGLMTDAPGILLGVTAADCVPLLFIEPGRKIAAAVHAGWRGTARGIATKAVAFMREEYRVDPSALHVAMGPSIGPCCYEVGREVREQIEVNWMEEIKGAWRPEGHKGYLDLKVINEAQLVAAGVPRPQVQKLGPCTACHVEEFFSYRKEGKTGSQLSFIGWRSSG